MTALHELRPGDRFEVCHQVEPVVGRLVALGSGSAIVEYDSGPREFVAHEVDGDKPVRIAGGKRRVAIALNTTVERRP